MKKQSPAGQHWVLGHITHIQHIKDTLGYPHEPSLRVPKTHCKDTRKLCTVSWPLFSNFLRALGAVWVPWSPKDTIRLWWVSKHQQTRFERHMKQIQHFQQCPSWNIPKILIEKIVHFWPKKKQLTDRLTDWRTDRLTDSHVQMRGVHRGRI